jgi:tetratricopeptide (TPR) repeat protein
MKRFIFVLTGLIVAGALFAVGSSGGSSAGTSASASQPKTPTALDLYNAGYAAAKAAKYDEAIKDFTDAIGLKSDYAEAYNMLGFCTRKQGNVAKAFNYYETALKLKPNFPEAREYYGEAYLQQGNLAKAVQQYVILQKAGSKFASELLDEIDTFVNQKG